MRQLTPELVVEAGSSSEVQLKTGGAAFGVQQLEMSWRLFRWIRLSMLMLPREFRGSRGSWRRSVTLLNEGRFDAKFDVAYLPNRCDNRVVIFRGCST